MAKALAGALPAAIACFEGSYGTVFVDVAFDPQGAAPQVMFSTKNQLPVESLFDVGCFQSALRGARLGPFSGSAFTATLPVRRMPGSDVLGKLADDIVSGKVALPGGSAPAPAPVPADYVAPKGDAVELTTTDITTLRDFRADRASILGVRLGMSMDDAKAKIGEHPGFSVSLNRANPTRLYVNTPAAPDSVLYLIWSPGNPRLTLITVFRTFEPWLQGGTKGLLHTDALDATSVAGRFLGKPDRSGVTLDVTSNRTSPHHPRLRAARARADRAARGDVDEGRLRVRVAGLSTVAVDAAALSALGQSPRSAPSRCRRRA